MAKMIKCPTCATAIEVPPQAAGQIVKCPGCGKGLKLVAKAKPQQPAHPGMSGAGMSPGGSIAGSSVSAMTYMGDAPPAANAVAGGAGGGGFQDDMPSLDSNCAVCGRATDPDRLTEDNGRLVCPDCIKGARSFVARPDEAPDLLDFKQPYRPARRGKLINITPTFLGGALAALILIACQAYLTLFQKPSGTGLVLAHGGSGGDSKSVQPPTVTPVDPGATPPGAGQSTAQPPAAPTSAEVAQGTNVTPPATAPANVATPPADGGATAVAPPDTATPTTTNPSVASVERGSNTSVFSEDDPNRTSPPTVAPGATPPPTPPPPTDVAPPPPPAVAAADPLDRGLERLMAGDYPAAVRELEQARVKHVAPLVRLRQPFTPQATATVNGLAAAHLGAYLKAPAAGAESLKQARTLLDLAYNKGDRTSRALVLNSTIAALNGPTPPAALVVLAEMNRSYLAGKKGDEFALDHFGTLLARIPVSPTIPREKLDALWAFYDGYVDEMSTGANEGKLKWGVDWLPADEVKAYRPLRGSTNVGAGVTAAAREVDTSAARVKSAQRALEAAQAQKAAGRPADVQGFQNQLDAANAAFEKAQKALEDATAGMRYKKPRWLDRFAPAVPEVAAQ